MTVLNGTILSPSGSPISGALFLQLSDDANLLSGGGAVAAIPPQIFNLTAGAISGPGAGPYSVPGASELTPPGLTYHMTVTNPGGEIVLERDISITGTSVDLGTIVPINPSAIAPPFQLGGDATGPATSNTVGSIRNRPLSTTAPTAGQSLNWNGSAWEPLTPAVGGDVTGPAASTTVGSIRNQPISATVPTMGQNLNWNGSAWTPATPAPGPLPGLGPLTANWPAGNFPISSRNSIDVFNVKAYGAVGDGSADDTAAIQDAIDDAVLARGAVYIPSAGYNKYYKHTGLAVNLNTSNQAYFRMIGDGPGSFLANTTAPIQHLANPGLTSGASWTQAGDMALSSNAATYTHSGGSGTLQQTAGAFTAPAVASKLYYLTYTISGVSGVSPAAFLTTGFASATVAINTGTNATYTSGFYTAATPGNFGISVTSGAAGAFTINEIHLVSGGDCLTIDNSSDVDGAQAGKAQVSVEGVCLGGIAGTRDGLVLRTINRGIFTNVWVAGTGGRGLYLQGSLLNTFVGGGVSHGGFGSPGGIALGGPIIAVDLGLGRDTQSNGNIFNGFTVEAVGDPPLTISGVTNAAPRVVTTSTHGYSVGDIVAIAGTGLADIDGLAFQIGPASFSATTFSLIGTTAAGGVSAIGTSVRGTGYYFHDDSGSNMIVNGNINSAEIGVFISGPAAGQMMLNSDNTTTVAWTDNSTGAPGNTNWNSAADVKLLAGRFQFYSPRESGFLGKLGVGKLAPTVSLDVIGSAEIQRYSAGSVNTELGFKDASGVVVGSIGVNGQGGDNSMLFGSGGGFTFYAGANPIMGNFPPGPHVVHIDSVAGNVGIGVSSFGTSAATVLGIGNGTAPSTSPADVVQLWAEDVAASAELRVRDEAGNVTTLSGLANFPIGVTVGAGALATTATSGFLHIPTCAGTPTGTPTITTGLVPMIYDSTDNVFYIYTGGAWKQPKVAGVAAPFA